MSKRDIFSDYSFNFLAGVLGGLFVAIAISLKDTGEALGYSESVFLLILFFVFYVIGLIPVLAFKFRKSKSEKNGDGYSSLKEFIQGPGIFVFSLVLILLFSNLIPSLHNISVSDSIISGVALVSLYLAWKKWIFKSKAFFNWSIEIKKEGNDEVIRLVTTNTGEKVVKISNFRYGFLEEREDSYMFVIEYPRNLEERRMKPNESLDFELGRNLIISQLDKIWYKDWKGNSHERVCNDKRLIRISKCKHAHQEAIQKLFEAFWQERDHLRSTKVPKKDIDNKEYSELVEEHIRRDKYIED